MFLQHRYLCKFPASFRPWFHRPLQNSLHKEALAVLRGGQELLPLKVAPIQPSVTAAFHLQSRRDSDCQMWELLYTLNIKPDSVISHLCLWLQQSWLLYLKLNRTIAKNCHIGIITFLIRPAYRLVEPWNSLPWESLSHGLPHIPFFLYYYHEFSSFCDFLLFRNDKTVKNKGHGLLGFYISNLSYTRTISTTRGSSILARPKCS